MRDHSQFRYINVFILLVVLVFAQSLRAEEEGCDIVAYWKTQEICAPSVSHESVEGSVGALESEGSGSDLFLLLWDHAVGDVLGQKVFVTGEETVSAYARTFSDIIERNYEADKKTASFLQNWLARNSPHEELERKVRELLNTIEASIFVFEKRKAHHETFPEHFDFIPTEIDRQIAEKKLVLWQVDKALFEKYGGVVVRQEGRLVPVEAYLTVIDYMTEENRARIVDAEYSGLLEKKKLQFGEWQKADAVNEEIVQKYFGGSYPEDLFAKEDERLRMLENWLEDEMKEDNDASP